jgi:hypothetical protein
VRAFRSGGIWVLICTELMGRGIDFKGVNLVINYDFPPTAVSGSWCGISSDKHMLNFKLLFIPDIGNVVVTVFNPPSPPAITLFLKML